MRSEPPRRGDADPTPTGAGRGSGDPDLRAWLEARIERIHQAYAGRGRPFRVLWVVAAVLVVLFGLFLTVVPGPALVVIPLGLAMLAAAFGWAHRLLTLSIGRLPAGGRPPSRRFGLALTALVAAAAVAGVGFALVARYG